MPEISIRSIFQAVQHGSCDVARLTTDLTKIYNVGPYPVFWEDFCYHLKFSMIVYERQPAVEHTINFVVNFATSLVMKLEEDEELVDDDAEGMHPFLAQLLQFLLQSHNANSRAVRFRSCLLINKLLFRLGEEAQIDNELYDVIQDSMLVRLRDICPIVRVQAAFAMARLQDPDLNSSCPIIESFQFHLSHDPSSDVRRAVLLNIAVSRRTLPVILERTRDEKDSVRKLVLEIVAEKVHVKAMTIAQRVKLLQDGLSDRAVAVKKACSSRLVQKWLSVCDDNIVTFLRCLDVENSTETSKLVLESMFSQGEVTELVKDFKLLNDEQVIPVESLSCESVLYWHQLCKHIQSQGTEFIEQLEQLLPTATVYSEYLAKIFDEMKKSTEVEEQLENEFIMDQLLQLAEYLDITDIVGRKSLEKVIKEMILDECAAHTMLKSLLARFKDLYPDQTTRCRLLVEMISDVRQPIVVTTQAVSEDEQRRIDVKLASIRVQINEVKEELTTAVESSEFSKAAELKEQLHELDKQRQELLDTQPAATQSEERQEKNDPLTLLYCLTIASEMLQHLRLTTLTPEIQTLNEVLILPGIQNEDPTVRNMAVRSLGLCCLMDKEIAKSHLLLLTQISQIDQEHIRVSALQFMFDLLLTFGLNVFEVDTECNQDTSLDDSGLISDSSESDDLYDSDDSDFEQRLTQGKQKHKKAKDAAIDPESLNTARSLLNIFVANLNSESCDIRNTVAEGLAKLLLSGWVVSHRLLSRLLLLWYNPITDDDTYLRHCLGTFFTVYAFSSRANQEVVEQSFMLTLQTVLEAPPTSPLAEVDINNVAELLVQLTSEQHQLQPLEGTKEMTCHDNLAMKLASHIISDPRSFGTLTLIKVLNMLTIASTSVSYLKELRVLSRRMMKEVKDKQCVNHLAKFRERIKSLLNDARHGSGNVPTDGDLSQDSQLEMSQVEDTVNETPPRGSAGSLGSAGDVTSTPSLFSSSPRPTATPMPGAGQSPRPVATPMPSLNIGSTSADRLLSTDDSMQVESSELDLSSEVKQEAIDESDVVDSLSSIDIVDSAKKTKRAPKKAAELKSKGARRKSDVLSVPESDDDNEEADPTSDEELVKDVSKKSTRTRAKKTVDNDINSSPRSSRSATTSASQDSVPSKRSSSRRAPSVKEVAKKGKRAPEKRKAATPTTTDQSESDAFITADESQESSTEQLIAESPRTSTRITRAKPKGKKAVTPPKKKAILSKTSTRSKKNLVVGSSESDEESVFTTPSSTSTDSNLAPVEKWSKSRTTRAASAPTKKTLAPEAVKPTRTSTRTTRASRK